MNTNLLRSKAPRIPQPWHLALAALLLFATIAWARARTPTAIPIPPDAAPVFSMPGGYYPYDIDVALEPPMPGLEIRCTLDGSTPTLETGLRYTRPLSLDAGEGNVRVIRARVVLPDNELGPVVSASYIMNVDATLPLLSLIVDPDDLWDPETGIYTNPLESGEAWERPVDLTYIDEDRQSGFHSPAGVRIHGGLSRTFDQKSLRLYFRNTYGAANLAYPLFDADGVTTFKRLVLHSGAQDASRRDLNWTLMRNQVIARLAEQVHGNVGRSQAAWVFINGESWGIYQIRERLDTWFLMDHYGIADADLLDTPDISEREDPPQAGDYEHWDALVDYVEHHDLNDPEAYAYVDTQVDVDNLIDYTLIQVYAANYDWLHRNVDQFRSRLPGGQWEWFFWDNDWSLGLNPFSPVEIDTLARVLDPDDERTDGDATILIRGLLENPSFRDRFLARTADLLNTYLAPYNVIAQIDDLAAELAPDMDQEAARWPSIVPWENSVQDLRNFAQARPAHMRKHTIDAFDLEGVQPLAIEAPANGEGRVAVNGYVLPFLPWQGYYFMGMPVEITAVPAPGYRFAGWQGDRVSEAPVLSVTVTTTQTLTPRFEPADPESPQPGDVTITTFNIDSSGNIEGDWIELRVNRPDGVDLRGWRLTDNDTKTATDEGSLILPDIPNLENVPHHTTIRIIASVTPANTLRFPEDDLDHWDRSLEFYAGNGALDATTDPWFNLAPGDNLALLAPGAAAAFDDDQGIDFIGKNNKVTPASFGILTDGVTGE